MYYNGSLGVCPTPLTSCLWGTIDGPFYCCEPRAWQVTDRCIVSCQKSLMNGWVDTPLCPLGDTRENWYRYQDTECLRINSATEERKNSLVTLFFKGSEKVNLSSQTSYFCDEKHDCFTMNDSSTYNSLGFCYWIFTDNLFYLNVDSSRGGMERKEKEDSPCWVLAYRVQIRTRLAYLLRISY